MGAWFSNAVRLLKPNGKTVDKLAACKKSSAGYDTPCLAAKERTLAPPVTGTPRTLCTSPATIRSWDDAEHRADQAGDHDGRRAGSSGSRRTRCVVRGSIAAVSRQPGGPGVYLARRLARSR